MFGQDFGVVPSVVVNKTLDSSARSHSNASSNAAPDSQSKKSHQLCVDGTRNLLKAPRLGAPEAFVCAGEKGTGIGTTAHL
jgi:hypothetical protein